MDLNVEVLTTPQQFSRLYDSLVLVKFKLRCYGAASIKARGDLKAVPLFWPGMIILVGYIQKMVGSHKTIIKGKWLEGWQQLGI